MYSVNLHIYKYSHAIPLKAFLQRVLDELSKTLSYRKILRALQAR